MKQGIVLFAHGSRDPEWSRPFEQIATTLAKKSPATPVMLAFLEHGPSLNEALAALAAKGAAAVRIVPVFLGQGGHIKSDLPRLVGQARAAHPAMDLSLDRTIGEQPEVIEAIAAVIAETR
ncbi:MAG TPA: CbiX/SirB N-terminal domain-containing protein [Burkholderiales bacterium]|nr:CbiX/SirB N-terminal domain-containing protein [Burkholderiales bacterium]